MIAVAVPGHDGWFLHLVLPGDALGEKTRTLEIEGVTLIIDVEIFHDDSFA